ncbi:LytR/AlgR family response regulator transcription factor [Pedobacter jejuensis]|uniref:DNA-binding response regulator n=1 Tax=Pedobacter jejuensis TaxID=1268550 RepID=A0A3N0BW92_9SPHI|nr:LytTR family DNA-binding domain-containing protein [Pedobacter jejuensis]RNL53976.1 DNA-binding response regulator [Pedobacter jejuensis]
MKTIAVDDEPVALEIISNHAKKIPFVEFKGTFLSASEALKYVVDEQIQLVFLDIEMPDLSGLEFAKLVDHRVQIVFTTAYSEHAISGFELAATDYLLKPINFNRFLQACNLANNRLTKPLNETPIRNNELFVKDGYQWVRISIDELLYVEGQDNYVSLYESQKHTMTRSTLSEFFSKLPAEEFVRVHKSYVVAISKIDKIERHQLFIAGIKIPLSPSYRESLINVLNK